MLTYAINMQAGYKTMHCSSLYVTISTNDRGCVTVNFPYGSPTVKMALQEPKNGYATTIFKVR